MVFTGFGLRENEGLSFHKSDQSQANMGTLDLHRANTGLRSGLEDFLRRVSGKAFARSMLC